MSAGSINYDSVENLAPDWRRGRVHCAAYDEHDAGLKRRQLKLKQNIGLDRTEEFRLRRLTCLMCGSRMALIKPMLIELENRVVASITSGNFVKISSRENPFGSSAVSSCQIQNTS